MKNSNILIAVVFLALVASFSFNFENLTGYGTRINAACVIGAECVWDGQGNACAGTFDRSCNCVDVSEDSCPISDLVTETKLKLTPNPFQKRLIALGTPMEINITPGIVGAEPKIEIVKYRFGPDGKRTGRVDIEDFVNLQKRTGSFKMKEHFSMNYHFFGQWEPGEYAVRIQDLGSIDTITKDYRYVYEDFTLV